VTAIKMCLLVELILKPPLSISSIVVSVVGTMMIMDCPPPVGISSSLLLPTTTDGAGVGKVINRFRVGLEVASTTG